MKKYIIAVGSEEISEKVQKALFSVGFKWQDAGQVVKHTDSSFLAVSLWRDGNLTHGDYSSTHTQLIRDENAILIASQDVIGDPFQLDGAKKPAVEMTVAEISTKLGYEVKITK
jgi:hypothetical protein